MTKSQRALLDKLLKMLIKKINNSDTLDIVSALSLAIEQIPLTDEN
jgi:hypothetical protein